MADEQKENSASYDKNPLFYEEEFRRTFQTHALPDVERFIAELNGTKILDVGCGPGIYLEYFREKGLDALGIDISDAFIQRCNEKGLNVRKMDMEKPLLYPYSFNGIWALSIVHIPRARVPALIKTWVKLLKSNGVLFVAVKKGLGEGFEPAETGDGSKRWFTYFSEEEMLSLFSPYFEIIHSHAQSFNEKNTWLAYLFRLKPGVQKRSF